MTRLLLLLAAPVWAQDAETILKRNCVPCHGPALKSSRLDLRSRDSILRGGERGPAMVTGKAMDSRLYRFAAGIDQPAMPPGKPLSNADIETLRKWIDDGAPMKAGAAEDKPADVSADLARLEDRPITAEERAFWAFVKPVRPAVPQVAGVVNPVDSFLRQAMAAKGLRPSKRADKRSLVRRAYIDLTGLAPAPAEVEAFVSDNSADAWPNLVEKLLASPAYGERWARHWLDLVRYADSGGYEYDRDRAESWRYRDYAIRAFNSDKPYDRFLREQLAGDEIDPKNPDALLATGYLRLGPENNLKNEQTRMDEIDDLIVTTSNGVLGLTVGCARCHNHKFDPIAQKDYYRMQAVFFSTRPRDRWLSPQADVDKYQGEMKRIDKLADPFKKDIAAIEKKYRDQIMAEKKSKLPVYIQEALRTPTEQRTEGQKLNANQVEKTVNVEEWELEGAIKPADRQKRAELREKVKDIESARPPMPDQAMAIGEEGRVAPPSYFLHRGGIGQKGSVMKPGVLSVASSGEWAFPEPPPEADSSYRRKAFADWIASPENPLTPRVMVNRIWLNHFGEGIVRTPSNFGKMGDRPSHPELLDWLATEFVAKGWSVKAMHRVIMNSQAYQAASDDDVANVKLDPENRMFWRMPRRRVEAEVVRDNIMHVAGTLDRTMGGPNVLPYIDPALFQSSSKRTWNGKADSDPTTWRRSVYVFTKRSIPLPMLDIFDKPDSIASCARRNRSTIAPQALILMNNAFVMMQAKQFAQRLQTEAGAEPSAQIRRAFELALSRPPADQELEQAMAFVKASPYGLVDFCQTMFNLNEFLYMP